MWWSLQTSITCTVRSARSHKKCAIDGVRRGYASLPPELQQQHAPRFPGSSASSLHRQGFSSEALVLISCSLNVIMVMITQMTPGLWGDLWFIHPHTHSGCTSSASPAYESAGLSRSRWPAPPPLSCPRKSGRANNQIHSSQSQKS